MEHKLWVEKYRPKTTSEFIFHDDHQKAAIMKMIKGKTIPHLLFSGTAGTGKTTIAQILIKAMNLEETDVLTINASDERGIDVFRETIKNFALTSAMGTFKIVHLEEADRLTPPAQDSLKRFMEEMSDYVRFILTCNTVSRIVNPIRSRCQEFQFRAADKEQIQDYIIEILDNENVEFTLDVLDKYITYGYPDVRKIINTIQQNTVDKKLQPPHTGNTGGDWKFKLLEFIEQDRWIDARNLCCENVYPEEWEEVYKYLYQNLHKSPKFMSTEKWEEAIVIIAKYLYQNAISADSEINGAAMLISLGAIQ